MQLKLGIGNWELGIGRRASEVGSRKLKPSSFDYAGRQVFLLPEIRYIRYIRPYEPVPNFLLHHRSQILGDRKMHPLKAVCQPKFVSFH
ncbi:hypothetical protein [Microcoleus sp. CAWBG58]|uniref:hypothetical protein n=1 Tax=Microcoleus sp. CAWBG58 TaxID=2841651 RepID=UPI0025D48872|nr:hypothetical protein [Microcoleus sp. CAWBG58]